MSGDDPVNTQWYLFFYNLATRVLSNGGALPTSDFDLIDMVDMEAATTDGLLAHREDVNTNVLLRTDFDAADADFIQARRETLNAVLLQSDIDVTPTLRDLANALMLGTFDLLPDPVPLAQPVATVTVGASPFTYQAPYTGTLSITGGTVSLISIIRQGTTVATGITAGLVPVSKFDKVQITYSVLPTVVFLPT